MRILREISTKNYGRYYSDDITSIKDVDLDKILVHEIPCLSTFIYHIICKTSYAKTPLRISFDKLDKHTKKFDEKKYLK